MSAPLTLFKKYHGFTAAVCAVLMTGCMVGPNFLKPENGLYKATLVPRADYTKVPLTSESNVPEKWWMLFNDAVLEDLELRAQVENLDLQIASERIEQSRAQLGIASSELLPTLDTNASYAREALSGNGKFAALGAPTTPQNFWQVGFDAGWEIDLWGRARRAREGAVASLEATFYDREAARVALSAEVARTYLQLRGIQSQLDIAQQNLNIADRSLKLAESRERNGVATRFETSSARAQMAAIQAAIPELIQNRNMMMNALALLLGEKPRSLDALLNKAIPLPSLPNDIPVGVPSELAQRRPDIQRAEAQLHAATAAIGVAKADFYPRIGLRGRIGVEAFDSGDLSGWDSRFFSIGPTVYLPIFQGGKLTQRLALTETRQKSVAIAYRQTVLQAWHEIDNALDACAAQRNRHAQLIISYEQNKVALQAAERGYQEGAADYLSVLIAQRSLLASQSNLNTSATSGTLALVNLYKALGGGWNPKALKNIDSSRSGK